MTTLKVDFLADFNQPTLIRELQRLADELKKDTLTRSDIDQHGKMSSATVLKHFGSLRQALQAAGLRPTRYMKASDRELLDILEKAWVTSLKKNGRAPMRKDFKTLGSPVSSDVVVRRFGSWKKALIATAERAAKEGPPLNTLDQMPPQAVCSGPLRKSISVRKRFNVMKRDSYTCQLCQVSGVRIEVDHIVPVARGGTDAMHNLQTLCFDCNRGKRDSLE